MTEGVIIEQVNSNGHNMIAVSTSVQVTVLESMVGGADGPQKELEMSHGGEKKIENELDMEGKGAEKEREKMGEEEQALGRPELENQQKVAEEEAKNENGPKANGRHENSRPAPMNIEEIPKEETTPGDANITEHEGITPSKPRDCHQKNTSPEKTEPKKTNPHASMVEKQLTKAEEKTHKEPSATEEPRLTIPDLFPRGLESKGSGVLVFPDQFPVQEGPEFQESNSLFYKWLRDLDNPNINAEHIFGRSL